MTETETQHELRARRAERGTLIRYLVYLGLLVILCPVSWVASHSFFARSVPPAPWDESDLGVVPPPAENGYARLVMGGAPRLQSPERRLLNHVEALGTEEPERRWNAALADAGHFERYLADPTLASVRRSVEETLARPRFADACVSPGGDCQVLSVMGLARHAAVLGLADALAGRWEAAFARAKRLVHAALDYLETARTVLAHMVAIAMAQTAVDHLRVLVAGLRTKVANAAAGETDALGPATLAEVRGPLAAAHGELTALRREDVHCERAMIAEDLWVRDAIQQMLDSPDAPTDPAGFASQFLVDRGRTIAWADDYFRELHRHAAAPDRVPPPPFDDPTGGLVWWIWNPGGKHVVTMGLGDYPAIIHRFETEADAFFRSRDALRAEAEPLLHEP